jgi:hypothetical protein
MCSNIIQEALRSSVVAAIVRGHHDLVLLLSSKFVDLELRDKVIGASFVLFTVLFMPLQQENRHSVL